MSSYVTATSNKHRKTALLLCLFGGFLGLHQFYVGRIGRGLFYVLTVGGIFILPTIDFFKILFGTYTDNVGVPLREW